MLDHLALAEKHVQQGQRHTASQRKLLDRLRRAGHDTRIAAELLRIFIDTQALHLADHERLLAALNAQSS